MEIVNVKVICDEKRIKEFGFKKCGESSYKYSTSLYKSKSGKDTIYADLTLHFDDKKMSINVVDSNTGMGYTPFYQMPNYPNLVLNKVTANYKKFIDKLVKAGIVGKENENNEEIN